MTDAERLHREALQERDQFPEALLNLGHVLKVLLRWKGTSSLPATIDVRPFHRRDLRRIVEIEHASFGKDAWPAELFVGYWRDTPELFLVARHGRRIAGYSITGSNWRGAELDSIAVDPRHRGHGVAQALLVSTTERLRSDGLRTLRLMVSTVNLPAMRFYRKFGFVRTRLIKGYYGAGRDAWRMSKSLGPKQQAGEETKPHASQKMPI